MWTERTAWWGSPYLICQVNWMWCSHCCWKRRMSAIHCLVDHWLPGRPVCETLWFGDVQYGTGASQGHWSVSTLIHLLHLWLSVLTWVITPAVVGCISDGQEVRYRARDFMVWWRFRIICFWISIRPERRGAASEGTCVCPVIGYWCGGIQVPGRTY